MNLNHLLGSRSDFSISESMLQIDHLIADAKDKGYESVTQCRSTVSWTSVTSARRRV
jgi:hypothetical protein